MNFRVGGTVQEPTPPIVVVRWSWREGVLGNGGNDSGTVASRAPLDSQ